MKISKKEVERIAGLARLKLEEKEKEGFVRDLSLILDYIEKLKKADTKAVQPLGPVSGRKNRPRKDEVSPFAEKDRIIRQAPREKEGFIETNKIFQ